MYRISNEISSHMHLFEALGSGGGDPYCMYGSYANLGSALNFADPELESGSVPICVGCISFILQIQITSGSVYICILHFRSFFDGSGSEDLVPVHISLSSFDKNFWGGFDNNFNYSHNFLCVSGLPGIFEWYRMQFKR